MSNVEEWSVGNINSLQIFGAVGLF